jgi:hypothetical protein
MRLEEVLPALREGKCIQRTTQPLPWTYMKLSPNGAFHWYGYGDDQSHTIPMNLDHTDVLADDWVVVDEEEAHGRKPAPSHWCGRRGAKLERDKDLDHWRADGTCSYCGSCSGDDFMAFVKAGGEVGPTDKSYKAYMHDTATAKAPGGPAGKFYFQHLSEDQMKEFVALLNEGKVTIGYPHYFYTRPFFITYGEAKT